jgi:hypothetical protein
MKIRLVVGDEILMGSVLPKWYGIAYRDWVYRRSILYIIPLNLIVCFSHQVYWLFYRWLKYGSWKSKLEEQYWTGYRLGCMDTVKQYEKAFEKAKLKWG